MFFTLFWYWSHGGGGVRKGLVDNLLRQQFFTLDSSKMEVFETHFFDIVITQNDHPSYVKHLLGCIYVFSPYLGIGWGHEATETGLAYAPVSQAHGHNHIVQCFACCTAA